MAPSTVRKEEAELRKIAKESRAARKVVKKKEQRQQQRTQRAAARAVAAGDATADSAVSAPRSTTAKKGAIILPDELVEMRNRLGMDESAHQTSPTKGKKKATAAAAKRGSTPTKAAPTGGSSDLNATVEPNYHSEIHVKRKQVLVDVVLHHVPPAKILVTETTPTTLVVDTTGHSKKYRLVLPMPAGVAINVAEADFELENGVLRCVLPIAGEALPDDLQKQCDAVTEKIKSQRALRFRVGQDGELKVRTRQALLAPSSKAQAELRPSAQKRGREVEAEEDQDEAEEGSVDLAAEESPSKAKKAPAASAKKAPAASAKKTSASSAPKKDVFKEEHAKAMEQAKASASAIRGTIKERVHQAKEVQKQRLEKLEARSSRKDRKVLQRQQGFERVLEEQKRQLMAQAALRESVQAAEKQRQAAKEAGVPTKSVKFAA